MVRPSYPIPDPYRKGVRNLWSGPRTQFRTPTGRGYGTYGPPPGPCITDGSLKGTVHRTRPVRRTPSGMGPTVCRIPYPPRTLHNGRVRGGVRFSPVT